MVELYRIVPQAADDMKQSWLFGQAHVATGYRSDIDGLRALAVLAVVLFHARSSAFSGGFVGVDVFFVISGFLITSLIASETEEGRFLLRSFYERRIRRIVPALIVVLLASSAIAVALFMPHDLVSFGDSVVATTFFVANLYFWVESGYFAAAAETMPLLHMWSLGVEEQFYIVFPVFLMLVTRWFGKQAWAGTIALVFAVSLALSIWGAYYEPHASFYMAPTRAWELLMGSLLALGVVPPLRSRIGAECMAVGGLVLIGWSVVTFDENTVFPGLNALFPCVGTALLIHAGQSRHTITGRFLSLRPLVFIGLISYSLYLWHWPLLAFGKYYMVRDLTFAETAALIVMAGILAAASWHFVEVPARRKGRRRVPARRLVSSATAVLALVVMVGGLARASGGWPERFDERVLAYAQGALERDQPRECLSISPGRSASGELCELGPSWMVPSFIVWGDSHADMLRPMLNRLASEYWAPGRHASWNACPPLLGLSEDEDCRKFNETMLAAVAAAKPRAVFLAAHWSRYDEAWFDRYFKPTVEELARHTGEVVIVLQVPELRHSGPSAMATLAAKGMSPETYATPRPVHESKLRHVTGLLDSVKEDHRLRLVDPTDVLCGHLYCRSAADGYSLYYDDNHLSARGANYIGGLFEPLFREWSETPAAPSACWDVFVDAVQSDLEAVKRQHPEQVC